MKQHPTAEAMLRIMEEYSQELEAGDMFLFTYSGHGGQMLDTTGEEEDLWDETYCTYNRQLLDDEIHDAFCKFKPGVRILVFLDSCHSGTATKGEDEADDPSKMSKQIPIGLNDLINRDQAAVYDEVRNRIANEEGSKELRATVKTYSACQDNQLALAGRFYSLFTETLLDILSGASFPKNYEELENALTACETAERKPNYFPIGPPDTDFDQSIPFTFAGSPVPFVQKEASLESAIVELLIDTEEEAPAVAALETIQEQLGMRTKSTSSGTAIAGIDSTILLQGRIDQAGGETGWDLAYKAFRQFQNQGTDLFIEPNTHQQLEIDPGRSKSETSANLYMPTWPSPEMDATASGQEFAWHLDEAHSQLAAARDSLMQLPAEERRVRIGHIDTGYIPEHPSTPEHVLVDLAKSFVKGEEENPGIDIPDNAKIEQDGHGLATLAILAGNKVTKEQSYDGFEGYLGAVPFAEIVPIRIADSVALVFDTHTFAEGIYYAIETKCDVVSMSMAGTPSKKWARAINAAYEAGLTVVTAAGNNWRKGFKKMLPKVILYPSRFDRVISATGVCVNDEPYDFEANSHTARSKTAGGENMQGNWGPKAAMRSAVAGYTPNLPWAINDPEMWYKRSGGGTSSATPQVAATAALWIAKHRKTLEEKGYTGTWKQVEAVKKALFETADKSYLAYEQYYGNGSIKAMDALQFPVPEITDTQKAPKANVFFIGVKEFLSPFWQTITKSTNSTAPTAVPEKLEEMAVLEITQLLYKDPALLHYSKHLNLEDDGPLFKNARQAEAFRKKLKASKYISAFLKSML